MDLNWLIPKLVAGVAYSKGPNCADAGDFSAAGNASLSYLSHLPANFVQFEGGTGDYSRPRVAGSTSAGPDRLTHHAQIAIPPDPPARPPCRPP